jgi:hypothetical protein
LIPLLEVTSTFKQRAAAAQFSNQTSASISSGTLHVVPERSRAAADSVRQIDPQGHPSPCLAQGRGSRHISDLPLLGQDKGAGRIRKRRKARSGCHLRCFALFRQSTPLAMLMSDFSTIGLNSL